MKPWDPWIQVDFSMRIATNEKVIIEKWCNETTQGDYDISFWHVLFELESDATMFTLRWC